MPVDMAIVHACRRWHNCSLPCINPSGEREREVASRVRVRDETGTVLAAQHDMRRRCAACPAMRLSTCTAMASDRSTGSLGVGAALAEGAVKRRVGVCGRVWSRLSGGGEALGPIRLDTGTGTGTAAGLAV